MDVNNYTKISQEKKLPLRCPILDSCGRRAFTLYFFRELNKYGKGNNPIDRLKNDGLISDDFEKKIIYTGEEVLFKKSDIHIYYNHVCPEVNLFDDETRFPFIPKIASTDGEWDDLRTTSPKFENQQCKHFSQCPEFAKKEYEKKSKDKSKRPLISKSLRFEILRRDNFTCCYCGQSPNTENGVKLHVDHVIAIANGGKTEINNLKTSCQDCNIGKSDKIL